MPFFNANMPFLIKIWLFLSIKEEEKNCIWPSQCKYAFSDVYPRGSAAIDMFWISNISEFGPRGGGSEFFNKFWNSKSSELTEGLGCHRYVLNFKHFWIWSEGGGSEFFNNFWNSKSSELSEGGGSSLIGNFSQIFSFFFSDASPN